MLGLTFIRSISVKGLCVRLRRSSRVSKNAAPVYKEVSLQIVERPGRNCNRHRDLLFCYASNEARMNAIERADELESKLGNLEALYPDVYKNVHEYGNRFCKGGVFGMYQGASNHEELHNLMKATVMIRRLKKDVLSELPMKRRQQVFLDLAEKDMKKINALFREVTLEDRRPASNMDPYVVTGLLTETTILWEPTLEAEALAAKKLAMKM